MAGRAVLIKGAQKKKSDVVRVFSPLSWIWTSATLLPLMSPSIAWQFAKDLFHERTAERKVKEAFLVL